MSHSSSIGSASSIEPKGDPSSSSFRTPHHTPFKPPCSLSLNTCPFPQSSGSDRMNQPTVGSQDKMQDSKKRSHRSNPNELDDDDDNTFGSISSPAPQKYYRKIHHRIFVNRSLHLDKIKFFGFDMDYTLAEYMSPEYEALAFKCAIERMIKLGYPQEFIEYQYDPEFPARGLWFDKMHGNLLKVDAFGNILLCVHGFKFLKPSEIYDIYPNKFVNMDESRIYVLNTLFNQPETYLLACAVDYFSHKFSEISEDKEGVKRTHDKMSMPYKSIFQDIRQAFDYIHGESGSLKPKTVENMEKFVKKHEELPKLFNVMRKNNKKIFLLTNSDYNYTNKIMDFLFQVESAQGRQWHSFFDYIVVDARKPLFFGEGTIFRRVNTQSGTLQLGGLAPESKQTTGGTIVYSGGNCDVFADLIQAKGRDVLYVGDHVYGDILKSKKTRGWRTFLVIPELENELRVWTSERSLYDKLTELDVMLAQKYKDMDLTSSNRPDISELKRNIRETIHKLDMSYGKLGSIFRCGSRQTHFASQVSRYADLYGSRFTNLLYYPFSYLFRAPPTLMPHEATVTASDGKFEFKGGNSRSSIESTMSSPGVAKDISSASPSTSSSSFIPKRSHSPGITRSQSLVPHLFLETPQEVTHHHDTDEEDGAI